ncbi:MAG: hypothetical protein ABJC04_01650 [Verrucomicrobiota bacterium]
MTNQRKQKPLAQRLDHAVQKAGLQLAAKIPRRSFFGRLSSGIILLGGAGLILKPNQAQAGSQCLDGCRDYNDVSTCYAAWTNLKTNVLYKAPWSSEVVRYVSNNQPVILSPGMIFGRASLRTGGVSNGCPDPGPRPSESSSFIWGYSASHDKFGWLYYAQGYATGGGPAVCGPTGKDFDCRYSKSACPAWNGCGGNPQTPTTCSGPTYYRLGNGYEGPGNGESFYIRYAANSTPFGWMMPGDIVHRYGYNSTSSTGEAKTWSCIRVICAQYVPYGTRGWIGSSAIITGSSLSSTPASCNTPLPVYNPNGT